MTPFSSRSYSSCEVIPNRSESTYSLCSPRFGAGVVWMRPDFENSHGVVTCL